MSEHQTEIRIHGASARDVLRALLDLAGDGAGVALQEGFLRVLSASGAVVVDHLSTRADGVVRLHLHDAGHLHWPAEWWVYRHTSVSRGIDFEALRVTRGERVFLEVLEGPDGDLKLTVDGEVRATVRRCYDDHGARIADAGDGITWRGLVQRGLDDVAGLLGEGARVLRDGSPDMADLPAEPPSADARTGDDEIPF